MVFTVDIYANRRAQRLFKKITNVCFISVPIKLLFILFYINFDLIILFLLVASIGRF